MNQELSRDVFEPSCETLPGAVSNSNVYLPENQTSLDAKARTKKNLPIVKSVEVIKDPYNLLSTLVNDKYSKPQNIDSKYQRLFDATCDYFLPEDVSEKILPYFEILIHFSLFSISFLDIQRVRESH